MKSNFDLSVLTLSFGSFISQFIGFLFLPFLSRLFTPDDFGEFYSYSGFCQFVILVSTLKFEKAIVISKDEEERSDLLIFTLFILSLSTIVIWSIVSLSNLLIPFTFDSFSLLPIAIFSYASYSIFNQYFQAKEDFLKISVFSVIQVIFIPTISIVSHALKLTSNGLIIGYVFGATTITFYLFFKCRRLIRSQLTSLNKKFIKRYFQKYSNFPKYYLFYDLLSTGFVYALPIMLVEFYSKEECGLYSMAYRILMVPYIIISISVSNVFFVKSKQQFQENGSFRILFRQTFFKVISVSFLVYTTLYFSGDYLIIAFLGPDWISAGEFIPIICFMLFFEFVSYVFKSNSYLVTQRQSLGLKIQVLYSILAISILWIFKENDLLEAITYYAYLSIFFSCINLIISYYLSLGTRPALKHENQ